MTKNEIAAMNIQLLLDNLTEFEYSLVMRHIINDGYYSISVEDYMFPSTALWMSSCSQLPQRLMPAYRVLKNNESQTLPRM